MKSIRREVDPAQLVELEETSDLLDFWQKQSKYLDFNLMDDNGRMERMINEPHRTVLGLLDVDREEVSRLMQFPSTRRELLDKLQVRLIVFDDRIEVRSLLPIKPIYSQKCTSPFRRGGFKGVRYRKLGFTNLIDEGMVLLELWRRDYNQVRHGCASGYHPYAPEDEGHVEYRIIKGG